MNESNGKRKPIQSNDVIRVVITPPLDSFRIRLRTWFLFLQSANSMTRWQHNSSNLRRRRRFELTELIASKRDDLNEMQSAFGNHSRNQHERITTPVKSLQSTINTDQEMGSDKERERERERERGRGREGGKKIRIIDMKTSRRVEQSEAHFPVVFRKVDLQLLLFICDHEERRGSRTRTRRRGIRSNNGPITIKDDGQPMVLSAPTAFNNWYYLEEIREKR